MKNTNKKGFTLIELMVVVIIVAILAAVALPLMSGNRRKAMSSEALAGAGTVLTNIRLLRAENDGSLPSTLADGGAESLGEISATDLDGNYFDTTDFEISGVSADLITVTVNSSLTSGKGKYEGKANGITVSLNENGVDTFAFN